MKTKLFFSITLLLIIFTGTKITAQNYNNDPFIVGKGGLFKTQTVLQKSGFTLTQMQIIEFMAKDAKMESYSKPLKNLFLTQTLVGAAGSILSTWPLIQLEFSDKEPNLNLTYYGLGAIAVSYIIKKIFMKKAVKAANYYNNGYKETVSFNIDAITNKNGTGIAITF